MQRANRLEENTPRFLLLREIRGRVKRLRLLGAAGTVTAAMT
jgi:hypothetical protein